MSLFPLTIVLPEEDLGTVLRGTRDDTPILQALRGRGLRLIEPLPETLHGRRWQDFAVEFRSLHELPPWTVLHPVPGDTGPAAAPPPVAPPGGPRPAGPKPTGPLAARGHPESIEEAEAVRLTYAQQIEQVASLLGNGLPVLVVCDKTLTRHLHEAICLLAELRPALLEPEAVASDAPASAEDMLAGVSMNPRQRRLARLREMLRELKHTEVLVLPHLDLLCGGSDISAHAEGRDLVELLYEYPERLVLAFAHTALPLPEVLAERFSVRVGLSGMPPQVSRSPGTEIPLCEALVTEAEAGHFTGFDAEEFFKYVAGMSPVRLRQAMRYAHQRHGGPEPATVDDLRQTLLEFKAQQSQSFELPNVTLDDIGGYEDVKTQIRQALRIIQDRRQDTGLLRAVQGELIPRGFIFHGPPGTGKTLFAKAIAREMKATVQVVSGPEMTDMYVGESERKIRELFAAARRSAPSVIVFDEFDALATERSGRSDGASRAGNSIVAQILTEMDGFRPDVQMLVIGTTNRIDMIDPALLRPSRFQSISIALPDVEARRAILRHHARRYGLEARLGRHGLLDMVANAAELCNGDELRSIVRDAYVGLVYRQEEPDAWRLGSLVGQVLQTHRDKKAARR
ncbi:ATP-binding protein [Kitasatospora sp. NPDC056181]|uniref:ATP-binding protein n=1 Tax=Kitasatospora sp. NPDC056181 TaxID=3345737 RepID=UPI0035DD0EE7